MTQDAESALELAQNTYLKAFAAISRFDGRASAATWLYRIAVNEALQFLRRARSVTISPEFAADRPDPRDDGDTRELRMDVESALASLEPVDRAMLLLRYQEGLDYRTIAVVTDVAVGTVGSRLNRARARLRRVLADYSHDGEESAALGHRTHHGQKGTPSPGPSALRKTV
jgi:RNA polymerase sigma-70 factor (ECF subfamily)